jgi:hypothetical protein
MDLREIGWGNVEWMQLAQGITMDLREIGWGSVEWMQLAQVASSSEYGDEPLGSGGTELAG